MNLSSLLPNLKAVFFDLDDVLVFSETTHIKAWKLSLPHFGINPDLIDFQSMIGISDLQQATLFKSQFNVEQDAKSIFELKRETFLELCELGFESALGRNQLLEKLSQSYVIGVVSSSVNKVVNHILKAEKIAHFFNFVIAYEDCMHHKPDPTPYLLALKKAGVLPNQALVIEDSLSGLTAAINASIPVVGLLKEQRSDQMIKEVKYFNSFIDIDNSLFS